MLNSLHFRGRHALLVSALVILAPVAVADTLFVHGHIYSGNPKSPWVESLLVQGERIAAVGTDKALSRWQRDKANVVDLHGQTVIPGIVDSHVHLLYGAYALHGLNLTTPLASITVNKSTELVARVKSYAAAHPEDPVILARADFSAAPPSTPNKDLLDRAIPDRPVVVHNSSEHSLWVNSAALRMAGVTDYPVADLQEERGIIRDASGHPTGTLIEAGMEVMERAVNTQLPAESKLAMLEVATHYLNSFSITSVVHATGNLAEIRLYATLRCASAASFRCAPERHSVRSQSRIA